MTRDEIISQVVRWHTACMAAETMINSIADALMVQPESPLHTASIVRSYAVRRAFNRWGGHGAA